MSCSVLTFLHDPVPRSNRWADFHALRLKRRVSAQGWSFWGLERWVNIFGKICPQPPPPMGVNGKFQAKTEKNIKSQYVQNYKSDQDQIWRSSWNQQLHFAGGLTLSRSNPIWLPAAILKKWIWCHNSADDRPITAKFGRLVQNYMLITIYVGRNLNRK